MLMKIKLIFIVIVAIFSTVGKSQTSERITGFSDFRIFFNVFSISAGGDHFAKGETIIPFGAGFEINYSLSKRFSSDFGVEFRTTGNRIEDSFIFAFIPEFSGPYHHEYIDAYLDIPIHLGYQMEVLKPPCCTHCNMFFSFYPLTVNVDRSPGEIIQGLFIRTKLKS